ncbi:MAG TPA: hypothetical protein VFL27_14645 [Candidatus Dormibacteraeota bacterium]|nr:hypothetical protein [Candidatus Dormibacteraeota bacterium]
MGYGLEALAYVCGTALIAAGVYLVMRGSFPAWWGRRLLWPLAEVTPRVARLQGWAAIGLGASVLTIVFSTAAGDVAAGVLVVVGLAAYLVAAGLFALSTWLSRRAA